MTKSLNSFVSNASLKCIKKRTDQIFKFKTFKAHAEDLCESTYLLEQLTGQNFLLASLVSGLYLLHSSLTWTQCCLLLIWLPKNFKMGDSNDAHAL